MTILLDTPLVIPAMGGKPQVTHLELAIIDFRVSIVGRAVEIMAQYGNTEMGLWVGARGVDVHHIHVENRLPHVGPEGNIDADPAFDILIGASMIAAGDVDTRTYDVVARQLYELLISKYPEYAGTIG